MKKLRCIIADDEPVARKILNEFIDDVPFLQLLEEFESVNKLDRWLQQHQADILFLDIEMPQKTGVQFLKENQVKPLVILTTAYPEYAVDGYELDILDYLLKPIAFKRFLRAVLKAKEYAEGAKDIGTPKFIFVRCEKRIEKINFSDILFIESAGNYVIIHLMGKQQIAYLTLKSITEQVPMAEFIRVHQSFLVNLLQIDGIDNNSIWVKNKQIPIGRNYREQLTEYVMQHTLKRNI